MADGSSIDRDTLARAVLAEAGGEPDQGQTGVAAVILNRARASGQDVGSVVSAPGAFEAWGDPARRGAALKVSANDPAYQRALANVDAAVHGSDPTGGATNFLNPELQAQLGRPQPSWAQGRGVRIGKHVFYGGEDGMSDAALYAKLTGAGGAAQGSSAPAASGQSPTGSYPPGTSDDELYRALVNGADGGSATATPGASQAWSDYVARFPGWKPPAGAERYYTVPKDPNVIDAYTPGSVMMAEQRDSSGNVVTPRHPATDAQVAGLWQLKQSGKFDPSAPSGSAANPYFPQVGGNYPLNPGEWYVPIDDPNPRQVGDAELAANKQIELTATPEGRAALEDARQQAQFAYGDLKDANASWAPALERGLDQFGASMDATLDNGAARLGIGQGRPYNAQQASEAAYVANTERQAQEAAYAPAQAEGNARLGGMLMSVPLAEVGGNLLTGPVSKLGAAGRFVAGASDGSPALKFASPIARDAILGSGVSGAQNYLSTGDASALPRNMLTGAEFGGAFGLGARGLGAAGRTVLGGPISSDRAALAQTAADDYGINLRASQITGSPTLRTMDDLAGSGASDAAQKAAYNRALAQTIGEDAPALTKPVMAQAKTRIGQAFEDVANRNTITADNQLVNDLSTIESDAKDTPAEGVARRRIDDVLGLIKNGAISGTDYLTLTRQGGVIDRAVSSSNADVSEIGRKIRGALDDALERSVPDKDLAALSQARQQWKAMVTLEPLAAKAGPDGLIDPASVLPRVTANYDTYAYNGTTPRSLGDLAEIGSSFLKPAWGGYQKVGGGIKTLSTLAGEAGAFNLLAHNPEMAGVVAAGSPFAARGMGAAVNATVNNPWMRNRLLSTNFARVLPAGTEQLVAPIAADAGTNMLLQANRERQRGKARGKNALLLDQ